MQRGFTLLIDTFTFAIIKLLQTKMEREMLREQKLLSDHSSK